MKSNRKLPVLLTVVLTVVLTVFGISLSSLEVEAQDPIDDALRRRIASTVRERGTIRSGSSTEVRCLVPGQSTILSVVSEGAVVKKGDQLVTLDTTAIERAIELQRIELSQAERSMRAAKAEVASLLARQRTMEQLLTLQANAAKLERASLLGEGGELDQQLQAAEGQIKIGKARIAVVENRVKHWQQQSGEKAIPEDLHLSRVEASELVRAASARREFVNSILRASEAAKFEVATSRERMELTEEMQEIENALTSAKADLASSEQAIVREQTQIERLREDLKNCVLIAPKAGTVVYANQVASRTGGFTVEPGATVRERQVLIELPDLSKLQVRTAVNETQITQVRVGQAATVRIDALPDETIQGVVSSVGRVAEPSTWLNNDVKQYVVLVDLTEQPDFVRIGMTALVEIDTGKRR